MVIWSNTVAGYWLHDLTYQVILLTGIAVVIINLNPLIKLDGYYFFTEVIEVPDLKERSTAFLAGWFQNRVLGLAIDMPIVPRRRALLFILYAFASGAYSYTLLFFCGPLLLQPCIELAGRIRPYSRRRTSPPPCSVPAFAPCAA